MVSPVAAEQFGQRMDGFSHDFIVAAIRQKGNREVRKHLAWGDHHAGTQREFRQYLRRENGRIRPSPPPEKPDIVSASSACSSSGARRPPWGRNRLPQRDISSSCSASSCSSATAVARLRRPASRRSPRRSRLRLAFAPLLAAAEHREHVGRVDHHAAHVFGLDQHLPGQNFLGEHAGAAVVVTTSAPTGGSSRCRL